MSTSVKVVNLEGELVLSTLADHRKQILAAFKNTKKVLVSLGRTVEIDLYGIQLLYGARRLAQQKGQEFHITGPVPENIARRLYQGGFIPSLIREGKELEEALHEFGEAAAEAGDDSHA